MSEKKDKKFVQGTFYEIQFDWGTVMKCNVNVDSLLEHADNGYVRFDILAKKAENIFDQKKTHYAQIDDWKPDPSKKKTEGDDGELPF